jgi:hypothetical protein
MELARKIEFYSYLVSTTKKVTLAKTEYNRTGVSGKGKNKQVSWASVLWCKLTGFNAFISVCSQVPHPPLRKRSVKLQGSP